jgi:hypothetical protein
VAFRLSTPATKACRFTSHQPHRGTPALEHRCPDPDLVLPSRLDTLNRCPLKINWTCPHLCQKRGQVHWNPRWHSPKNCRATYDLHFGNAVMRSFAAAYGMSVIVSSG